MIKLYDLEVEFTDEDIRDFNADKRHDKSYEEEKAWLERLKKDGIPISKEKEEEILKKYK